MLRNYPLHTYILQHNTSKAIKEIETTQDIDALNEEDLTPLQLASIVGENTVALALLAKGADPDKVSESKHSNPIVVANARTKAVDLAKKYHHLHVEKTITDTSLYAHRSGINIGYHFFQIISSHDTQSLIADAGLIELAAYCNKDILPRWHSESSYAYVRRHSLIRSATYWAAHNDNESLFKKLCLSDEDAAHAVLQLMADRHPLAAKYKAIINDRAQALLKNGIKKQAEKIEGDAAFIYERACAADLDMLKTLMLNNENLYSVMVYAYQNQNYVALYHCILVWKEFPLAKQKDLTWHIAYNAIIKGAINGVSHKLRLDLLDFWLTANQIHPFELLLECAALKVCTKELTKILWSETGLLRFSISKQIATEQQTRQEKVLFLQLEKSDGKVFNTMLECLQIHHPNATEINKILITSSELPPKARLNEAEVENFSRNLKVILNQAFKQFNLTINCESKPASTHLYLLPDTIWRKILNENFSPKEKLEHQFVSHRFYFASRKILSPINKQQEIEFAIRKIDSEIADVPNKLQQLRLLLNLIEDEISTSNRNDKLKILTYTLLCMSIVGLNIYCSIRLSASTDHDESLIYSTVIPKKNNKTCDYLNRFCPSENKFLEYLPICPDINDYHRIKKSTAALCLSLCSTYKTHWWEMFGSSLSCAVLGILSLVGAGGVSKTNTNKESKQLSTFSVNLQQQAALVFPSDDKPLSLDRTVGSIKTEARTALNNSKTTFYQPLEKEKKRLLVMHSMFVKETKILKKAIAAISPLEIMTPVTESKQEIAVDVADGLKTPLLDDTEREGRESRCPRMGAMSCVVL